jgi:catechol 2,3-dioxygenase-like lactoylglutathione lyase family enzyme
MGLLTHLRFLVDDPGRDVAFYRDVMGLPVVVEVPGVYAEMDGGGARLAFYRADLMADVLREPAGTRRGDDVVICLRVPSVDEEVARLAAKGLLMLRPPHDQAAWHQRVAHLRDASGRVIELWSPLRSSAAPETT